MDGCQWVGSKRRAGTSGFLKKNTVNRQHESTPFIICCGIPLCTSTVPFFCLHKILTGWVGPTNRICAIYKYELDKYLSAKSLLSNTIKTKKFPCTVIQTNGCRRLWLWFSPAFPPSWKMENFVYRKGRMQGRI